MIPCATGIIHLFGCMAAKALHSPTLAATNTVLCHVCWNMHAGLNSQQATEEDSVRGLAARLEAVQQQLRQQQAAGSTASSTAAAAGAGSSTQQDTVTLEECEREVQSARVEVEGLKDEAAQMRCVPHPGILHKAARIACMG